MAEVDFSIKNQIGYITLNQAEKQNALNPAVIYQLQEAFKLAEADTACRVIVLKAIGDAFCIGAEQESWLPVPHPVTNAPTYYAGQLLLLWKQIYTLKKVVIAQVQGAAIGDGCGLAVVCDLVLATPEATFGFPEVRQDLVPAGISVFLVRIIGEGKTKRLLLTGSLISATQAQELGLIHLVVPAASLEQEVNELAQRLSTENSARAMAVTKELIGQVGTMNLEAALTYAAEQNALANSTPEKQRDLVDFLKKQKNYW